MIPTPKYEIGKQVWHGTIERGAVPIQCPDCLGTKKWKAITPAGTEVEAECGRCGSWVSRDLPSLMQVKWSAYARCLTIGSVRIDTADERGPVEYMCRETGIGSGSIYREADLYETKEEAQAVADQRAAAETLKANDTPELIHAKKVGQLRLVEATLETCRDGLWHAWYSYRQLREDIEGVLEDWSSRDAKADIEWAFNWRKEHDPKNPVDGLVAAAQELLPHIDPNLATELTAALAAMSPALRKRPREPEAQAAE